MGFVTRFCAVIGSILVEHFKICGQNDSTHPEANDFKAFGFLSGGISICLNMARVWLFWKKIETKPPPNDTFWYAKVRLPYAFLLLSEK